MESVNINDVAKRAGVSSATVSRALRGLESVTEATRLKVEAAASDLNYHINRQASGLATGKTLTVGLVAPWLGTWYTSQVMAGAEQILVEAGYDLLVASISVDTLEPFLARARSFGQRVDGTLLVDVFVEGAALTRLEELGGPVVALGEKLGDYPSVTIDNELAAFVATTHLIELGHRRIGLVRKVELNNFSSPVSNRREAGWRQAHLAAGLEVDDRLVVDGHGSPDGGDRALHRLRQLSDPPTAAFCMSDEMAFDLLAAANQLGLEVPGDLSVVGFDDHSLASVLRLTTMRQNIIGMGNALAASLLGRISDENELVVTDTHPVELMVRDTTGPLIVK